VRSPIATLSLTTSIGATPALRGKSKHLSRNEFLSSVIWIRHRVIQKLGVHALWLGRYPYIVYYRVGRDEVAIVHIRHAARRPWEGEED